MMPVVAGRRGTSCRTGCDSAAVVLRAGRANLVVPVTDCLRAGRASLDVPAADELRPGRACVDTSEGRVPAVDPSLGGADPGLDHGAAALGD